MWFTGCGVRTLVPYCTKATWYGMPYHYHAWPACGLVAPPQACGCLAVKGRLPTARDQQGILQGCLLCQATRPDIPRYVLLSDHVLHCNVLYPSRQMYAMIAQECPTRQTQRMAKKLPRTTACCGAQGDSLELQCGVAIMGGQQAAGLELGVACRATKAHWDPQQEQQSIVQFIMKAFAWGKMLWLCNRMWIPECLNAQPARLEAPTTPAVPMQSR